MLWYISHCVRDRSAEALEAIEGVIETGLVRGVDAQAAYAGLVVAQPRRELLGTEAAAGVGDGVERAVHHASVEQMPGELDAAGADGGDGHLARSDGVGDGLLEFKAKALGRTAGEHKFIERSGEYLKAALGKCFA